MDDPERPPFRRIILDHIDMILYKVDQQHWANLASFRIPNKMPVGEPRKPPMPGVLLNQLEWFASVLFPIDYRWILRVFAFSWAVPARSS